MNQEWFEMPEVRRRTFERSVWIPLRAINTIEEIGQHGFAGYKSEFFGAGSLAVHVEQKTLADKLGWMDVGISHSHSGYIQDDEYIPSNVYKDYGSELVGEHLVLEQRGNSKENTEWHLSQDFVITLGLKREGDVWGRPDEGYIEIARLYRRKDDSPYLLEVRASHLRDYLCARKMALYITSYRDRVEVVENADHITWEKRFLTENNEMDRWEGRISEIHEGGMLFGEKTAVFHVARTDVDVEEDVPTFDFPTDDAVKSESWTKEHHGRKLYRIEGELWRNEWIDPAPASPIIRGDETPSTVYFITDAEGTQENKETLVRGSRWLWFRPEVVIALAHCRGGSLSWYTRYTGSVGCSPDYNVHFGINKLGLVNVYAKDIGLLPNWQQKIWAGYNLSPDGKVSEELLASQMKAEPAETQAPEAFLANGLKMLNVIASQELGITLLREHDYILELIEKSHRFRAIDKAGLYALAKDVARLTADSIDAAAIQTIISPPKGTKWGSLKSLENLLATKIDPRIARSMLSSLVGVYELRHADAHLPSGEVDDAFALIGVDQSLPYVHQGYQLLHACVSSIYGIADTPKELECIIVSGWPLTITSSGQQNAPFRSAPLCFCRPRCVGWQSAARYTAWKMTKMINTVINLFQKFNNRELAVAIWILIAIIWAFAQPKIRKSLFQVIKAFFAWKLAISYVLMFAYITLIIIPLNAVGIWKLAHLPVTILWVLGVAFIMLFEFSKANDPDFFKDAIKNSLKVLVILEFIINLYVFDLWVELILVPFFVILGGMIAIAQSDEKYEIVKKLLNYIMVFIILAFTGYAIYMVVTDFEHFATLDNFENFYLPILLSIMFLPFVYFAALYAGYESLFVRLQFFIEDRALLKYVKKKTILAFGPDLWVLNKWSKHINTLRFKDTKEVDEAIQNFKSATY